MRNQKGVVQVTREFKQKEDQEAEASKEEEQVAKHRAEKEGLRLKNTKERVKT